MPKSKVKKEERERLIQRYLQSIDSIVYCPALKADVIIMRKGKTETRLQASKSYKSTIVALNLADVLANATYIKKLASKKNSKNQKCFRCMHLLICPIKGVGYAKIMIGELYHVSKIPTKYEHYCVTYVSLKELKK